MSETVNNLFWKLVCFVHAWDTQGVELEPFEIYCVFLLHVLPNDFPVKNIVKA